jgi:hypothetical protein
VVVVGDGGTDEAKVCNHSPTLPVQQEVVRLGREGGREGGREEVSFLLAYEGWWLCQLRGKGRREGGREGEKKGKKEGGREGGREGRREEEIL